MIVLTVHLARARRAGLRRARQLRAAGGAVSLSLQRLRAAGSAIVLLGPYEAGDVGSAGIDTLEQLAQVPGGFDGHVWTNRIEVIGPALRR